MQLKPLRISLMLCAGVLTIQAATDFGHADFSHPDFFPILPWSPVHQWDGSARDNRIHGLASIAECGFNMAGFVHAKDLPECERLGLGAILFPAAAGLSARYHREWSRLSDEEIDLRVKKIIEASGSSPAIAGYFIADEPGLGAFPALGKAVAAVRKYAPGKWAYINLFPNYATLGATNTSQLGAATYEDYLERFISEVRPQVLSYDNYMVQYSNDLDLHDRAASYFLNLAQVRRAGIKHNLPCVQIVASNQLRRGRPIPTPANLRLQAYTTLAAGYRGVSWYNYYGRQYNYAPVDASGQKTETWNYLQAVNREVQALTPTLRKLRAKGFYFTAPAPEKSLPLLPGTVVTGITSTTPMMAGEFENSAGEAWVLLVNLSLAQSARFTLQTTSTRSWARVSAVDGELRPFQADSDGHWLAPGAGVLLRQTTNQTEH